MLREILEIFCIPFDLVTIDPYNAWKSGLFNIPFDLVSIGSYIAWNSGVFSILFDSVTKSGDTKLVWLESKLQFRILTLILELELI